MRQWYATIGDIRGLSKYRIAALGDGTAKQGAHVVSLPVYRTFHFTSGAAVDGLAANLNGRELKELSAVATVVSIGPSASKVIRSHGMNVGLESRTHAVPSVIEELVAYHRASPLARAQSSSLSLTPRV